MADKHQLELLKQGVGNWNSWRQKHPQRAIDISKVNCSMMNLRNVDLHEANLRKTDLRNADLSYANLHEADLHETYLEEAYLIEADLSKALLTKARLAEAALSKANLREADLRNATLRESNLSLCNLHKASLQGADLSSAYLRGANLRKAKLSGADLRNANLSEADLRGADLRAANLLGANLRGANLRGADLQRAILSETDLRGADLTGSAIFALSAWDAQFEESVQHDLLIIRSHEGNISVDMFAIAQFIVLWLNSADVRRCMTPLPARLVLLVGRFDTERRRTLDVLKEELRQRDYVPLVFDVEKAGSQQIEKTLKLLAPLALFVLADLTRAKSLNQALLQSIPQLDSLFQPFQQKKRSDTRPLSSDELDGAQILPLYQYADQDGLLQAAHQQLIAPLETRLSHGETSLSVAWM